jgi:hypothetical protein
MKGFCDVECVVVNFVHGRLWFVNVRVEDRITTVHLTKLDCESVNWINVARYRVISVNESTGVTACFKEQL